MKKLSKILVEILIILLAIANVQAEEQTEETIANNQEAETQIEVTNAAPTEQKKVEYTSHVQTYGWLANSHDGEKTGTEGESKRMEALKISLAENLSGNIEYITYVQTYGWENSWKKNGEISGTSGESKRLEAIRIRLTGDVSNAYDVYYRVHSQTYGWLPWAKNGETSGTLGLAKRVEALEVKLVEKNQGEETKNTYRTGNDLILYTSHMQGYGWLPATSTGATGVTGKSKRMEAYKINYTSPEYTGTLEYMSYIEGKGWENTWKKKGEVSGTEGQSKRIEQIKMRLVGEVAEHYDIYYRVHVQGYGWLGWAKNEETAGTENLNFRIESIEMKLVVKGTGEATGDSLRVKDANVTYSSHIRKIGDQAPVAEGEISGTTGQNLRMEALKINLNTELEGNILYKTYIDEVGWESEYKRNGELSGTTGQSKGIQLLRMKLEGPIAEKYDIYYRIHTETYGWLSWATNDEVTGADCYDIQAIQVRLYLKIDSNKNNLDRSRLHIETGFYKANGYTYYKDKYGNQATDWIRIMDKKYFFNSLGVMIGKDVKKVMDVSAWQANIDWDRVYREGDIDGVILRIAAGCDYEDAKLARNISEVKRLGIPYGIYIYSYAENYNEGKLYGEFTINMINKYNMNPRIGIFLDLESNGITNHLSTTEYEQITRGYMDVLYQKGYGSLTKIYTYKSLAEEKLNTPYLYNQITWIAHYNHFNRYVNANVVGWQYSSQEYVPGVPTLADMSVWFTNF